MKFPSLDKLAQDAYETLLRFPFVLLAATIATIAIISRPDDDFRVMLTSGLGIPLFFSLAMFGERRGWKFVWSLAGVVLLAGYYFTLSPAGPNDSDMQRFTVIALALHFLTAFAPYLVRNQLHGFWQYNKALFLRILISLLYTGVLYLGLALALLAINQLFEVHIDGEVYADLAAVLFGVFNTWLFLAGVPRDFSVLENDQSYPNGLKVFTQYVLLPLVVIYLIILYFYSAKIMLEWRWPKGWVSSLILGFSVAGILSSLLLYPVRDKEGNTWITRFYAWFYYALLPLTVLLMLAIGRRVSDYGMTEPRYYAFALAIWLAAIAIYMLITRGKNIRAIPVSLCILSFLTTFGPWGATTVSVENQVKKLQKALENAGLMVDNTYTGKTADLQSDTVASIRSIIYYLSDHKDGLDEVAQWMKLGADTIEADDVLAKLGLNYPSDQSQQQFAYKRYAISTPGAFDVSGYDRFITYTGYMQDDSVKFELGGDSLVLRFNYPAGLLEISRAGNLLLSLDLKAHAEKMRENYGEEEVSLSLTLDDMTLQATGNGLTAKALLLEFASARMGSATGPVKAVSFDARISVGRAAGAAPVPAQADSAGGSR